MNLSFIYIGHRVRAKPLPFETLDGFVGMIAIVIRTSTSFWMERSGICLRHILGQRERQDIYGLLLSEHRRENGTVFGEVLTVATGGAAGQTEWSPTPRMARAQHCKPWFSVSRGRVSTNKSWYWSISLLFNLIYGFYVKRFSECSPRQRKVWLAVLIGAAS